jgi:hypothetical protein
MKKGIIVLLALTILTITKGAAQNQGREKLEAYRIAFFTQRLNLTPQEAEKFWPVYNEFQNKRNAIQTDRMMLNRNVNQNELNMSEKEMTEAGDKLISLQLQEANLAMEYHKRFREILTPAKVIRLYQAENLYRIQLLNELKQNQNQRNNLQKGPGQGQGRNPF